ncbi:hypothetical protein VIGAN_11042900 [Vigna angularis var. angularis]|uniref:Uncharacterized protein n=1 Tax=Vigna angularis var. angularis TaxID=157739 RepID=A0A0S3T8B5_PHAAN|nr:hypothetical protein VIGAN_11042900 [Vigna angularis var. angularis]
MVIKLNYELLISSDKTIHSREYNMVIKDGAGLTMQFVNNIIIHGLKIHKSKSTPSGMIRDSWDHVGIRTRANGDDDEKKQVGFARFSKEWESGREGEGSLKCEKSGLEPYLMAPYGPIGCHMVPNESMKVRKKHVNMKKRYNGLPY